MENPDIKYKSSREVKFNLTNMLLISGDGRNVGKTTLGCRIIKRISGKTKVVAIKVSPHFHPLTGSLEVLYRSPELMISLEKDKFSGKDSSRYLNAGASVVYYIQCREDSFTDLSAWMHENLPAEIPVICESGGLKDFIRPGYAFHISYGQGKSEYSESAESEILFNDFSPEKVESDIKWENNKWQR